MGPPSCMRSVVDRNVVMRRMTVFEMQGLSLLFFFSFFGAAFVLAQVKQWLPSSC